MRLSYVSAFVFGTLIQACTVLLPRGVGDICRTPEGDGICQEVAACDGIRTSDANCVRGDELECCVSIACNTSKGEGICRRPNQGCNGGEFDADAKCPGISQCCIESHNHALQRRTTCSSPEKDTCTFYETCLEEQTKCGPAGYALVYGRHYCNKFAATRTQFSGRGKVWLTTTMYCLQKELVPYATGEKMASCDTVKKFAFATHPSCYIKSGVCILPPSDWQVIINIVGFEKLFDGKDAFVATLKTVNGCKDFYLWLIRNHIITVAKEVWDVHDGLGGWLKDKVGGIWKGVTQIDFGASV